MTRVLGIDPGSRATGYGVIDSDGRRSVHVESGCIRTEGQDFAERLGEIFEALKLLIERTRPQQCAVEQVFVAKNAASALKLGQARGVAICAAVTAGVPVFEYSPRSVKQALAGTGGADKTQVQHMVRVLLASSEKMGLDQSDALAVALCHAHSHGTLRQMRAGQ